MNGQMEKLKKMAEWHQSMADDYKFMEEPHAMGMIEYHIEQAQQYWHRYGRLMAELQTMKKWGEEMILLPGRMLK